jgi:hypothetical protein
MLIGDDVAEFLRAWHGPSAREPVQASTAGPLALREWWAYENAWETPLIRQNRVLRPSDIYQEAGLSVFYVENQAVWLWAHGDGSDPPVYARENDSGSQWEPVGERLSTFLHHMAVFEAILGEFTLAANDVGGKVAATVRSTLVPSPFIDWCWPGPRSNVQEGEGCLVFTCVNERPGSDVDEDSPWVLYVAGRTAQALSLFDTFGIAWDYDSR